MAAAIVVVAVTLAFVGLILLLVYNETENDFPTRHGKKRSSRGRERRHEGGEIWRFLPTHHFPGTRRG